MARVTAERRPKPKTLGVLCLIASNKFGILQNVCRSWWPPEIDAAASPIASRLSASARTTPTAPTSIDLNTLRTFPSTQKTTASKPGSRSTASTLIAIASPNAMIDATKKTAEFCSIYRRKLQIAANANAIERACGCGSALIHQKPGDTTNKSIARNSPVGPTNRRPIKYANVVIATPAATLIKLIKAGQLCGVRYK